jgi:anti-sigma B factor antagonist
MDAADGTVTVILNDHSAHVVLTGEFDIAEAEELAQAVEPLVADPPDLVIVNLGHVQFMGSTTLGVLITLREACVRAGREFVMTERSRCVERLFDVAGLTTYLGLADLAHSETV